MKTVPKGAIIYKKMVWSLDTFITKSSSSSEQTKPMPCLFSRLKLHRNNSNGTVLDMIKHDMTQQQAFLYTKMRDSEPVSYSEKARE